MPLGISTGEALRCCLFFMLMPTRDRGQMEQPSVRKRGAHRSPGEKSKQSDVSCPWHAAGASVIPNASFFVQLCPPAIVAHSPQSPPTVLPQSFHSRFTVASQSRHSRVTVASHPRHENPWLGARFDTALINNTHLFNYSFAFLANVVILQGFS